MPRYIVTMDTYLERIEEHFKVKFDKFRFIAHTVRQAHKHDIMDPKQWNQNQGGLGQLSKTFKFKKKLQVIILLFPSMLFYSETLFKKFFDKIYNTLNVIYIHCI